MPERKGPLTFCFWHAGNVVGPVRLRRWHAWCICILVPWGSILRAFFIDRARKVATRKRNLAGKHPPILCVFPFGAHQLTGARVFLEGASIGVAPSHYDASRLGLTPGGPRWQWQRRAKIRRDGYRRNACTLVDMSATPPASPAAFPCNRCRLEHTRGKIRALSMVLVKRMPSPQPFIKERRFGPFGQIWMKSQ